MKILVLKNKISTSQKKRLSNVKSWFSPVFDLEFTEEKSDFKNIPLSDYSFVDGNGKTVTYKGIDETWYDENISKPAKTRGFDIVILIVKESQWGNTETYGFGTTVADCGIQEIAIGYYTSGKYGMGWGGKNVFFDGDKLEWIIIHELLHRLCDIKGIEDNTHKYFMEETPEKCLQDFKKKINRWRYFKPGEKTGSLGHTISDLEPSFVDKVDELRHRCGFAFIPTSGYRTEEENKRVGGVAGSAHIKRLAIDIACTDSKKRIKIVGEAYAMGFIGIGIAKDFVHLDIDKSEKQRIFLY